MDDWEMSGRTEGGVDGWLGPRLEFTAVKPVLQFLLSGTLVYPKIRLSKSYESRVGKTSVKPYILRFYGVHVGS